MRISFLIGLAFLGCQFMQGQVFEVENIHSSGDTFKRINIVIVGDGYQEHEMGTFVIDATIFANAFLNESPFKEYKNYFNISILKVPSNESGASHPGTATDVAEPAHPVKFVDNYFGSSFDTYGSHRLLVPTKIHVLHTVLAYNLPFYDQVVVLVNSPHYGGGGGGGIAIASTHQYSAQIALHELGHSFANLADEYYAGDYRASERINMTRETNPANVKWKNWYNVAGIGIYQHCCGGNSAQWYRPHENCKMRVSSNPFCAVCSEAFVKKIHAKTSPIDTYKPANNTINDPVFPLEFEASLVDPIPNTLNKRWVLNNVDFDGNANSILIEKDDLIPGVNELKLLVQDATPLIKVDTGEDYETHTVSWIIHNTQPDPDPNPGPDPDPELNDDDNDGVANESDECPNTALGQEVDMKGCEVFSFDAFKIYTETPACAGRNDGSIEITATESTANYVFDVQLIGNGRTEEYENQLSEDSKLSIGNLVPGDYSIIISLDNGYSKTFDKVVVGEAVDISASLKEINNVSKTVTYKVSGSLSYTVTVNQQKYVYKAGSTEETDISIPLKKGLNSFTIKGLKCQSQFKDQVVLEQIKAYPNPVEEGFYLSHGYMGKIQIFSATGAMVKEAKIDAQNSYVDIRELTGGAYYIHFLNREKEILKIIKR
ncbi:M64 family metallopeptidase [Ulvibacterium sp.]|uniref:M64 family metallopeptidase n=1 Tax=Ulvibacterium sp. TaxID=2665914 RepID=UPI003BA8C7ED